MAIPPCAPRYEVCPLPRPGYAVVLDTLHYLGGVPSIAYGRDEVAPLSPENGERYRLSEVDAQTLADYLNRVPHLEQPRVARLGQVQS